MVSTMPTSTRPIGPRSSVAGKLGCTVEALRRWVRHAERDTDKRNNTSVRDPYAILADGSSLVPTTAIVRDDRIELRASREEKRLLAAAAAYQRLDLTTFVMRTALPVAEEVIARHERIRLSARDGARVLELLENPPKPTPALRAAARRLRRRRA
jgi:uncharacterized protein (DUF1778 family)